MKALEIAAVLNNTSTTGQVMAEVLGNELETLLAKVSKLEEEAAKAKKESDGQIAKFRERLGDAQKYLKKEVETREKLAEENKSLEGLRKANSPLDDESEDTARFDLSGLLEKMGIFEANLLNGVKHGFENDVAQLRVANSDVELSVEGISFLNWVEDGVIRSPPPTAKEMDGHVADAPTEEVV